MNLGMFLVVNLWRKRFLVPELRVVSEDHIVDHKKASYWGLIGVIHSLAMQLQLQLQVSVIHIVQCFTTTLLTAYNNSSEDPIIWSGIRMCKHNQNMLNKLHQCCICSVRNDGETCCHFTASICSTMQNPWSSMFRPQDYQIFFCRKYGRNWLSL